MIFKPYYYYYFERGCAAYLFGCGSLGKCAVVDAHQEDVDAYTAFAASKGMRITHVIDTHLYADHRSGGPALAERTGAAYCLHESADVALPFTLHSDTAKSSSSETRGRKSDTRQAKRVVTGFIQGDKTFHALVAATAQTEMFLR